MQPATKKSKQRDAIIKFLMTRKDHPTADMVYMNIKEEFPKISLGTVYRNLALLSERGEILKLSYEGQGVPYDPGWGMRSLFSETDGVLPVFKAGI